MVWRFYFGKKTVSWTSQVPIPSNLSRIGDSGEWSPFVEGPRGCKLSCGGLHPKWEHIEKEMFRWEHTCFQVLFFCSWWFLRKSFAFYVPIAVCGFPDYCWLVPRWLCSLASLMVVPALKLHLLILSKIVWVHWQLNLTWLTSISMNNYRPLYIIICHWPI